MGVQIDKATANTIRAYVEDRPSYNAVAQDIIAWAEEEGYKLYKGNNLTYWALSQRIRSYVVSSPSVRVVSQSGDDAVWVASQIRMRTGHGDPAKQVEVNGNNSLGIMLEFSRLLREFTEKSQDLNDPEFYDIITDAEIYTLRLIMDRLEK